MMNEKINLDANFNRAEAMLKEKGIEYIREDFDKFPFVEQHFIRAKDNSWDFGCGTANYGSDEGLLEYFSNKLRNFGEDPIGWLTAEEVVEKIEAGV